MYLTWKHLCMDISKWHCYGMVHSYRSQYLLYNQSSATIHYFEVQRTPSTTEPPSSQGEHDQSHWRIIDKGDHGACPLGTIASKARFGITRLPLTTWATAPLPHRQQRKPFFFSCILNVVFNPINVLGEPRASTARSSCNNMFCSIVVPMLGTQR